MIQQDRWASAASPCFVVVVAFLIISWTSSREADQPASLASPARAMGPLRIHSANPRYLSDGTGKIVFLAGSHTWNNFQDCTYAKLPSPPTFGYESYLSFLQRHHHNFFRLWVWESAWNPNARQSTATYDLMPYERSGSGTALNGKPKFDLTR